MTNIQPDKAKRQLFELHNKIFRIDDTDAPNGSSKQEMLLKRFDQIMKAIDDLAFDVDTELEYYNRHDDKED